MSEASPRPRRTAVIVTALGLECDAVCARLTQRDQERHARGTVYEVGYFETLYFLWRIGVVEVGAGNTRSALETERAIDHFRPQVVLLVGVAGGLKDLKKGHVVAATKIYGYESGKAASQFMARPQVGQSSYRLEQEAKAVRRSTRWLQRIQTRLDASPAAIVAPIVAGEKVVANTRSAVYTFLRKTYSDAVAVEMEAHGFSDAAFASPPVEAMVIRGISDLIDDKSASDDIQWQPIAADTASAFAFELLAQLRDTHAATENGDGPTARIDPAQYPDIASKLDKIEHQIETAPLASPPPVPTAPEITSPSDSAAIAKLDDDSIRSTDATLVGLALDSVKALIDAGQPEAAEGALRQIALDHWSRMATEQKYRHRRLLASASFQKEDPEAGARLILEALDYAKDNEKAQSAAVVAYQILGRREDAFALATRLRQQFPSNAEILANWLRAAPIDESIETLLEAASTLPAVEVAIAASERLHAARRHTEAVGLLKAHPPKDNHFEYWDFLGTLQLEAEIARRAAGLPPDDQAATAAIDAYHKALAQLPGAAQPVRRSSILLNQSRAFELIGEKDKARACIAEARDLQNDSLDVKIRSAQWEAANGDYRAAASLLREAKDHPKAPRHVGFLLAYALSQSDQLADWHSAQLELEVLLGLERGPEEEPQLRSDALRLLVDIDLKSKSFGLAREHLARHQAFVRPTTRFELQIDIAIAANLPDDAKDLALELLSRSAELEGQEGVRLARTLASLGQLEPALGLFREVLPQDRLSHDTFLMLQTAEKLGRLEFVYETARTLRERGVDNTSLIDLEIATLARLGDGSGSIQLAESYLSSHPDDRYIRLRLSLVARALGRRDLIESDPDRLPKLNEGTPDTARAVVIVLREAGNEQAALKHAYENLRRNRAQPEAWMTYLIAAGPSPIPDVPTAPPPVVVGPGVAVQYQEEPGRDSWLIIEESADADLAHNEFPPAHPFAAKLLGKKAGDVIGLERPGLPDRQFTILAIQSKYVWRYQQCMNNWEREFPSLPGPMMFHAPGTKDELTAVLLPSLQNRARQVEKLEKIYEDNTAVTIHLLADGLGTTTFGAQRHLVSRSNMAVRCSFATSDAWGSSFKIAESRPILILDTTALGTLLLLDCWQWLDNRVYVARATLDELRQYDQELKTSSLTGGSLAAHGDEVVFNPSPRDLATGIRARISSAIAHIETYCEVFTMTLADSAIPEQERIPWRRIGGLGSAQCIAQSQAFAHQAVLCCDDAAISALADKQSIQTCWTQVALSLALSRGSITDRSYDQATAMLVGWNYKPTRFQPASFLAAAELAQWDPLTWPLAQHLDLFAADHWSDKECAAFALQCLKLWWHRASISAQAEQLTLALLEKLVLRQGHTDIVAGMFSSIGRVFGINVVHAQRAKELMAGWVASRRIRP